jgi:hypothetical protein
MFLGVQCAWNTWHMAPCPSRSCFTSSVSGTMSAPPPPKQHSKQINNKSISQLAHFHLLLPSLETRSRTFALGFDETHLGLMTCSCAVSLKTRPCLSSLAGGRQRVVRTRVWVVRVVGAAKLSAQRVALWLRRSMPHVGTPHAVLETPSNELAHRWTPPQRAHARTPWIGTAGASTARKQEENSSADRVHRS